MIQQRGRATGLSKWLSIGSVLVCALAFTAPASATFHLMQVEQIIGGVNGDATAQAIQLRCRAAGQNLVSSSRIRAWDAAGANPIMIKDLTTNVANGAAGAHVLITSASFNALTTPATTADFTMTNVIPASYLAAGSLTFESDGGVIYWRLSWGGASYTGSGAGNVANDADGNFNPPVAIALSTAGTQAVKFSGAFSALSTNNLNDYALTVGAATFTNNAGASFVINPPPQLGACCLPSGACSPGVTAAACASSSGTFQGVGSLCGKVTCPQPCPADVTGGGVVNIDDLLAVINAWGPCAGCPADVNGSGQVNIDDLLAVINGWGPCP